MRRELDRRRASRIDPDDFFDLAGRNRCRIDLEQECLGDNDRIGIIRGLSGEPAERCKRIDMNVDA